MGSTLMPLPCRFFGHAAITRLLPPSFSAPALRGKIDRDENKGARGPKRRENKFAILHGVEAKWWSVLESQNNRERGKGIENAALFFFFFSGAEEEEAHHAGRHPRHAVAVSFPRAHDEQKRQGEDEAKNDRT